MTDAIVVRVHPHDELARNAVKLVLDKSHERRFKSEVLDFYRGNYGTVINRHDTLDDVMFLVAIQDDLPIGLSVCHLLNSEKKVKHSLTVVSTSHRKAGIGKRLLSSKLAFLKGYYPHLAIRTYVNKSNDAGIKLCDSTGILKVVKSGSKEVKTAVKDDVRYEDEYSMSGRRKKRKSELAQEVKKIEYLIYGA